MSTDRPTEFRFIQAQIYCSNTNGSLTILKPLPLTILFSLKRDFNRKNRHKIHLTEQLDGDAHIHKF